jgi:SAM-dependent methyltransferase
MLTLPRRGRLPGMTAEYFDQWFADIEQSPTRQRLFTEGFGVPDEVGPSNTLPFAGLQAVAAALAVAPGAKIADVACGRGGPGMWIARELGAELVGIDFSAEAIRQASQRRISFGLADRATFAVGTFDATGLESGSVAGVTCIDALQFAPDAVAAASEMRRILRPGGRLVLTCWEALDRTDEAVAARIRKVDLFASLKAAGFANVVVEAQPQWYEIEWLFWQSVRDLDPAGDPALASTRAEAARTLKAFDRQRRVMATAVAP